jgi:hypothetical protein
MTTKSSISAFSGKSKALAVTLLLGATFTLSLPSVADASVSEKDSSVSAKTGFIQQTKEQKQELSEKWGIELVAMRSTAAGHMVDFRYRVLDAEKAAPLFKRQTKPYLIHQGSGKVLAVPNTAKIGSLPPERADLLDVLRQPPSAGAERRQGHGGDRRFPRDRFSGGLI